MSVSKKLKVALIWLAVFMLTFLTLEKRLWKQKPVESDGRIQHRKPNVWMAVMLRTRGLWSFRWMTIGLIIETEKILGLFRRKRYKTESEGWKTRKEVELELEPLNLKTENQDSNDDVEISLRG